MIKNKYETITSKNLQEKCGVFGVINVENGSHVLYLGLHGLQHRGQDSSGMATFFNKKVISVKKNNNVITAFKAEHLKKLKGTIGVGHTRYPTYGSKTNNSNIQPFIFKDKDKNYFVTCHNGNLTNAETLKKELKKEKIKFTTDSDSEILGRIIEHSKEKDLQTKLTKAFQKIIGAYSYVIAYKDKLIGARDPYGIRPLVIGKNKDNEYIIASETVALDVNNFKFFRDIKPGEIVIINENGKIQSWFFAKQREAAICAMEYIYFARPDSIIEGQNVHIVRERLGNQLAIEKPVKADIVIGVPDSSLSAALGYSKTMNIPYEYGLVKNKYMARSFIAPSQTEREKIVKMKLNVNVEVIKNKDVVLIDDSIVRGTTIKEIVKLLHNAGAKTIHIRICSPEIKYPSFYGINIQDKKELILNNMTKAEYEKSLKYVKSLEFLSLEGMEKAINRSGDSLETSCFTGKYLIDLIDYKDMV